MSEVVYLAEGDTDTAMLAQAGLPVVGVRGAQGFKEEFVARFARVATVYVCADGDTAGLALVERAGTLLGNKARIVRLPDGEDVCSFVGEKDGDIVALAAEAPPYLDWLLERVPTRIDLNDLDRHVGAFVPVLRTLGEAAREGYVKRIAKRLGITVGPIREALRTSSNGHGPSPDGARIIWQDAPTVNPSQALVAGVAYTVVFLDTVEIDPETGTKVVTVPHVVTSRREVFALDSEEMGRRGLRYRASKVPSLSIVGYRWSTGAEMPHSVKNYVDGAATVAPCDVYNEVVGYLRRHVDYPHPAYHDFLALWTVGTYFFEFFAAYPYVHLVGTKRCGKTLTLELIEELAFNAVMSASLTGAAAYRTVEGCSASLLLDEAENLQKKDKNVEVDDDKIEILKAGYKRGGRAIRCAGENHEPTGYEVYSPKMFGSVRAIDRILGDRVITLTLARKRADVRLAEFRPSEHVPALHRTRDKLYVLMLDTAAEIAARIDAGIGWDGVSDRDRELWTPILVLAAFFDDALLEERPDTPADDLLTTKMRQLARESVAERQVRDRLEQAEVLMIEGVLDYLETATPLVEDFYPSKGLLEFLQGRDGLSWLKDTRQVYNHLADATAIIRARDLAAKRPKGADKAIKQTRCIRLVRSSLEDVAKRLGAQIPTLTATTIFV